MLLGVGFIKAYYYINFLANIVMVKYKKINGS